MGYRVSPFVLQMLLNHLGLTLGLQLGLPQECLFSLSPRTQRLCRLCHA